VRNLLHVIHILMRVIHQRDEGIKPYLVTREIMIHEHLYQMKMIPQHNHGLRHKWNGVKQRPISQQDYRYWIVWQKHSAHHRVSLARFLNWKH
jgi:hypothetical protein